MSKAEQRANELYPNDRAFCGGVASIARDAYLKGREEAIKELHDSGVRGCAIVLGHGYHSFVKESSPDAIDEYLRGKFKWGERVRIVILKEDNQ